MVNVPTGVWINEQGRIVRPNEVAFVDDRFKKFSGLDSEPYLNALKDWVEKGDKSAYVMSEDHLREKLTAQDPNIAQGAAEFGLGEQLYKSGHQTEAIAHFKEAQRLNPNRHEGVIGQEAAERKSGAASQVRMMVSYQDGRFMMIGRFQRIK
jgi:tetratricopeptide (TPR) repeat protein